MSDPTSETLLKKIATGDPHAENELFQHFNLHITTIVQTRLRGRVSFEDQKDLVAEIHLGLLQSLRKGSFDASRGLKLSTYIAGIVNNTIAQYYRKKARNREFAQPELPEYHENCKSVLDVLLDAENKKKLKKKLGKLKSRHQKVLLLRYYENRSIAEISELLDLEHKKVIDRLHYALKRFVEECQKDHYFSILSIFLQIIIWLK